jgi:hypothetical protein
VNSRAVAETRRATWVPTRPARAARHAPNVARLDDDCCLKADLLREHRRRKRGPLIPRRSRNSVLGCRGVDSALQQKRAYREALVSNPTQPRPTIGRAFYRATLETEICGQRLWARRAENCLQNAGRQTAETILGVQAAEISCYFRHWEITPVCKPLTSAVQAPAHLTARPLPVQPLRLQAVIR